MSDCQHRHIRESILLDQDQEQPTYEYRCLDCAAQLEIDPVEFTEYQSGERDDFTVRVIDDETDVTEDEIAANAEAMWWA